MNGTRVALRAHAARLVLALLVAALGYFAFPAIPEHGGVALPGLGTFGLNALMIALFGVILYYFRPEIYRDLRDVPFFALGWIICGGTWLWMLVRSIVGVIALARDEPVPNPYSWLL